ncbi:MAG: hypothetical protein WCB46_06390 [Methanoregula sp.]
MRPGDFSDASRTHRPDNGLLKAASLQDGEKSNRYPDVTICWLESLPGKDELDSDWCSRAEESPVRTRWWFPNGAPAPCIGLVWIFWSFT